MQNIENEADESVKKEVAQAEADPEVSMSELTTHIYVDNDKRSFILMLDYIRGKLYEESIIPKGQRYWLNGII